MYCTEQQVLHPLCSERLTRVAKLYSQCAGGKEKLLFVSLRYMPRTNRTYQREAGRELCTVAWRSFLMPTFMGLCLHARQAGMSIKAYDKPDCLEIYFQPVMRSDKEPESN